MKALYLLSVLSLVACTNIDGKYATICEQPVARASTNSINNATGVVGSVYTQSGYMTQVTGLSYLVKKGDSIYAIARKFGLSPASILARNPLINASTLKIGSALYLPTK